MKVKQFQIYIKGDKTDNLFLQTLIKDYHLSLMEQINDDKEDHFVYSNGALSYHLAANGGVLGPFDFCKYWNYHLSQRYTLKNENFDLVLSGLQSDDQGNSQLGILLLELLDMSHASLVMGTEVQDDNNIKVKRELEGGWFQWTTLTLPASISIQSGINTPRYATLKGIMMVKNKTVEELQGEYISDLNLSPQEKIFLKE